MNRLISVFAIGAILVFSNSALAGEPTGRYQGAVGSLPASIEQVYVEHAPGARGVTAAFAENIPAAQIGDHAFALLQNHGRAYAVTAMSVPDYSDNDVRLASGN